MTKNFILSIFIFCAFIAGTLTTACFADEFSHKALNNTIQNFVNYTGTTITKGAPLVLSSHGLVTHSEMGVDDTTTASDVRFIGIAMDTAEDGAIVKVCTYGFCYALFSDYATVETTFGTSATNQRCDSGNTGGGFILANTAIGTLAPVFVTPRR